MATATSTPKLDWQLARKYIARYKNYLIFEDNQPTVVAWYETDMRYGGPEESGWWYETGWPVKQICVFNKKQAIKAAIELHTEALEEYEEEKDYLGWSTFSIDFKICWAQPYPTVKPHYE